MIAIPARTKAHVEHRAGGHAARANIDVAAAKGCRLVRRVGLVHLDRTQNRGGEKIERNNVAAQLGRGYVCTVQGSAGVTLAEPAHIDVLAIDQCQASDSAERRSNVGVSNADDLVDAENLCGKGLFHPLHHNLCGTVFQSRSDNDFLDGGSAHRRPRGLGWSSVVLRVSCRTDAGGENGISDGKCQLLASESDWVHVRYLEVTLRRVQINQPTTG